MLPANGGAVLSAIVNTSRSNIKNIAFQLDGGDPIDILSVEGGQLIPDDVFNNTAPFRV